MSRQWRKLPDGRLVTSVGDHGTKVQLFQKRSGGTFWRAVWNPAARRKEWRSLRTRNPAQALKLGKELHAKLVTGHEEIRGGSVTLGALWRRFSQQCRSYLDNKPESQKDTEMRARTLLAFFGENLDVSRITPDDVQAYIAARRIGGIQVGDRQLGPCRDRTLESDIVVLQQMLKWATTVWQGGKRWLAANPLTGIARPRERNPRRPVATRERYEATKLAIRQLIEAAKPAPEGTRWLKLELALLLAYSTGRRLGSIRQLQWSDFNWEEKTIRWRAENDKKGKETVVPYPAELFQEIRRIQRALGALHGWCFAAEKDPTQPMDRHLFDKWLVVAEKDAKLPKLEGGLWHPYRRAWATSRMNYPIKAVSVAGGWTDAETLIRCYQHPDRDSLLQVTGLGGEQKAVGA